MSVLAACSGCKASFRVKDEFVGRKARCPKCGVVFQVALGPAEERSAPPVVRQVDGQVSPPAIVPVKSVAKPQVTAEVDDIPVAGEAPPIRRPPVAAVATSVPVVPSPADRAKMGQRILAAFEGQIGRKGLAARYRVAVVLVAVVMILLPLLYLGIIAGAGYLVYLHAVHNTWLLNVPTSSGRARGLAALIYFATVVAGGILLLFMVKPLFARPAKKDKPRSLTADGEPLLFAFVERVCAAVGAPRPKRIDVDCQVNASASFRRGWWSVLLGNDLVLTIGLPLVAGFNVRQFAGVLAHEFGHFSQGVGMRISYIIRSISFWFTRVVYERDEWDQRLIDWSQNSGRLSIIFYLTRLFVWLTRRILWVLMMVGHVVSGLLLRQMEFDADRYETALGGSDTFEATSRQLNVLGAATQAAFSELSQFYADGRLGDNLPKLIAANIAQISEDVRDKLNKAINESSTGTFDTHPCDRERIAAARRQNAPGIFRLEEPAAVLFSDFKALSKTATWDYYRATFGPEFKLTDMHPVDDLLARYGKDREGNKSLDRYFQGSFRILRPVLIPSWVGEDGGNVAELTATLGQARQQMLDAKHDFDEAFTAYDKADTMSIESEQVLGLLRSGFKIKSGVFHPSLTSTSAARQAASAAVAQREGLAIDMQPFELALGQRLATAMKLLGTPQVRQRIDGAAHWQDELNRLLPALARLRSELPSVLQLRNAHAALAILAGNIEGNQENADLFQEIREQMGTVCRLLDEVWRGLGRTPYPFDHAKGEISIGRYVLRDVPSEDNLGAVYDAAGEVIDKLPGLYVRIMGRVALAAESVETAVGLPPLPDPLPQENM